VHFRTCTAPCEGQLDLCNQRHHIMGRYQHLCCWGNLAWHQVCWRKALMQAGSVCLRLAKVFVLQASCKRNSYKEMSQYLGDLCHIFCSCTVIYPCVCQGRALQLTSSAYILYHGLAACCQRHPAEQHTLSGRLPASVCCHARCLNLHGFKPSHRRVHLRPPQDAGAISGQVSII
jgi:hypothetical protein